MFFSFFLCSSSPAVPALLLLPAPLRRRAGFEIKLSNYLLIRLGNNSNALNFSDSYSSYFPGLSGGIGIQTKKWDIDVGFFNLETAGIITGLSLLYKQ